jgi:hypothetical protein
MRAGMSLCTEFVYMVAIVLACTKTTKDFFQTKLSRISVYCEKSFSVKQAPRSCISSVICIIIQISQAAVFLRK